MRIDVFPNKTPRNANFEKKNIHGPDTSVIGHKDWNDNES